LQSPLPNKSQDEAGKLQHPTNSAKNSVLSDLTLPRWWSERYITVSPAWNFTLHIPH
jgi:hypothetical protein